MMMRKLSLMLLAIVVVVVMAACGNSNDSGSGKKSSGKDVELTMWMFTGTGLEPFVQQYEKDHPNIKVKIQQQEYGDHHNGLVTALEAGGAPDIALVEIGYIDSFKRDSSKFYNLADYGAQDIMGDYLEWKRVQASSQDLKFIFGIPTDVGPMAMMYRTDIFGQAGLPTDPAGVSDLIKTWDDFLDVGKTIKAKTGKPMLDGAGSAYDVIKGQLTEQYFDDKGNLIADTNAGIKRAYDYSMKVIKEGLSANIGQWSPEWGAGMNNGDFAVQMAPAWMMGFMKENAPGSSGKWNAAQMPEGSGNWGGSFLTLPKEGKHANEAFELIKWLLAPKQQLALFKANNNFPSTPSVYDDAAIQEFTDEFFSNAPVGKIYAEAAKKVVPVYYGPDYSIVDAPLKNAILEVQNNKGDPAKEWDKAFEQIKRDLKR